MPEQIKITVVKMKRRVPLPKKSPKVEAGKKVYNCIIIDY
jgi:hypothetical protein